MMKKILLDFCISMPGNAVLNGILFDFSVIARRPSGGGRRGDLPINRLHARGRIFNFTRLRRIRNDKIYYVAAKLLE